jgi:hypothetical protein
MNENNSRPAKAGRWSSPAWPSTSSWACSTPGASLPRRSGARLALDEDRSHAAVHRGHGLFCRMMVFAGRCQDKFGPRLVATAGGIMLGLGLVASGLVHSPIAMALTFGVGAGLGIGLGYSATTPPAIKWFPPRARASSPGLWSAAWAWRRFISLRSVNTF